MGWRSWNKTSTEKQTGGRKTAVGPPVCFLKAIPREIFSIKFAKPAPRENQGCTRTICHTKLTTWTSRSGATCLDLSGAFLFAGFVLHVLG
jgi:hypothetical protein